MKKLFLATSLLSATLALGGCLSYGIDTIERATVKKSSNFTPFKSTPNPYGISNTIKINTRDADTLYKSINSMVEGLSQRDQLKFMEDFFNVAYFARCDIDSVWVKPSFISGPVSFRECLKYATKYKASKWAAKNYVSTKRLDDDPAYTAINGFGHSRTGGHTKRASYVNFIESFSPYIDGKTADYFYNSNINIKAKNVGSKRYEK